MIVCVQISNFILNGDVDSGSVDTLCFCMTELTKLVLHEAHQESIVVPMHLQQRDDCGDAGLVESIDPEGCKQ